MKTVIAPVSKRGLGHALRLVLASVLMLGAAVGHAGQTSGQFHVTVSLQSAGTMPESAFCQTDPGGLAFGAVATIVCATGAVVDIAPGRAGAPLSPMHGGAYRFVTEVWRSGNRFETVDVSPGIGTTTLWRVVHLANRDYLEMTVAW
ncbi:MAG: hypothetical protein EHM16_01760 [Betaproteobacteria bacterium]|nr:MAG: hypothetical protein EHM16_01760 [Betaproteobacteria bacterium]